MITSGLAEDANSVFPSWEDTASAGCIRIDSLAVTSRIGVTQEERAFPQRLLLDVAIFPGTPFEQMADDLHRTVDYAAVCREIAALCGSGERALLETLAVECVRHVLCRHLADRVAVRIRKFILPETAHVAVEFAASRR